MGLSVAHIFARFASRDVQREAALLIIVLCCAGSKPVPDELRLVLYALHQQATVGTCTEAKPWGWNVVESAKWESWNQLGNMSSVEAMRLYVRMVEDAQVPYLAAPHAALGARCHSWGDIAESSDLPPFPVHRCCQTRCRCVRHAMRSDLRVARHNP